MAKITLIFSFLICLSLFREGRSLTRYISHVQNYVNLVSSYNLDGYSTIDFPPLSDVSQAMVINIDMHLYAVNGFDEVAGNIELVVALEMTWIDQMSVIQSISFKIEDRAEFLVPYDMIWTPKLVLTNAIGETSDVGDSAYLCRFDMYTKRITWKPRVVVSGSCTPDVTYYPFDKQECDFVYTAWGFKADEIMLTSTSDEWNMNEYGESGEWEIDSSSTETYTLNEQSYIKFKLAMVRKPLYFAFNILLPILVLCLLNSTVFLLPAESGERVGFSVTCFLSFMVLLNMIMDIMPRSSNPISFLCYYLVVMMANSGAMTLVTILLMRVYHKPEKSKVPLWMQRAVTFVNCGCARLRCCVLCCRYIRNKCCCPDKRKCGCKKEKSISEETLIEISVDGDKNIIEKTVKKTKSKITEDDEKTKSNKCCFLSCVKHDNTKSKKWCYGCRIGCKICKKKKDQGDKIPKTEAAQNDSSACYDFFKSRKRKTEDAKFNTENTESKKPRKVLEENEPERLEKSAFETKCIDFFKGSNERKNYDMDKEQKSNACTCLGIKRNENGTNTEAQTVTATCTCSCKDSGNSTCSPNFPNRRFKKIECTNEKGKDNETSLKKGEVQTKDKTNASCFDFLRRTKVSSLDESCIEDDILPTSTRSQESKTQKVSFKGKDKIDTEETLLQRWEEATADTTNKKNSSLNPIDQGEQKNTADGNTNEEVHEDNTQEITLTTKSIRVVSKEKGAESKEISKPDDDNSELDLTIVRKTRSRGKTSVTNKEKLPRPFVQEKVVIPIEREKISASDSSSNLQNAVSKKGKSSDEQSDNDEDVDSLADLEEEVSWPEVGRILDTFFFLAFAGGQAFLTVVFLVPLFTGDTKSGEN